MKKKAFITGINGQDGSYLSNLLVEKGYKVYGLVRRNSINEHQTTRLDILNNKIDLSYGDLLDESSLESKIRKIKPDEIYNLAAQSHVKVSFEIPQFTVKTNSVGVLNMLEAFRKFSPKGRFYQASSSEMFGKILKKKQNEKTPFNPRSPYAVSKVFGHYIVKNYRESYKLFAVSGILFNHESPFRGEEFVTRKITKGLIKILEGHKNFLELGNIYSKRDWGYAKEYVEAMWKMLQQKKPEDFVISTGKTYSIKQFINLCTDYLGIRTKWIGSGLNEKLINLESKKTIIKINPKYFRPAEVDILIGDSSKAKRKLKWGPKTNLKTLVKIMIDEERKFSD